MGVCVCCVCWVDVASIDEEWFKVIISGIRFKLVIWYVHYEDRKNRWSMCVFLRVCGRVCVYFIWWLSTETPKQ